MIDPSENYKQIDDIIDYRKKLGQYNVCKQTQLINYKPYTLDANSCSTSNETMIFNEGDLLNSRQTESEITLIRVKCDGLAYRRPCKWDLHDIAIPGDGSHLGESPSMVNLATLVEKNQYLVPLSSWDPSYKCNECYSNSQNYLTIDNNDNDTNNTPIKARRRFSLAGKISKFLRKHCKKSRTDCQPNNFEK